MSREILVTIRKIPWPKDGRQRRGMRLRWDAVVNGEVIVRASSKPFEQASAEMSSRGEPDDAIIRFRHEDLPYDSFHPMRLGVAARQGLRNRAEIERFRARLKEDQGDGESSTK